MGDERGGKADACRSISSLPGVQGLAQAYSNPEAQQNSLVLQEECASLQQRSLLEDGSADGKQMMRRLEMINSTMKRKAIKLQVKCRGQVKCKGGQL